MFVLAAILLVLLMWWLWPDHKENDLAAPPKDYAKKYIAPDRDNAPTEAEPVQNQPVEIRSITPSRNTAVKTEADYSEEDLMMRDVRAALHRGAKGEAVRRVRRTKKMTMVEAMHFVDEIAMAAGQSDI